MGPVQLLQGGLHRAALVGVRGLRSLQPQGVQGPRGLGRADSGRDALHERLPNAEQAGAAGPGVLRPGEKPRAERAAVAARLRD